MMLSFTTLLRLTLGATLISVGRRLYWLFVAVVGFFVGLWLAGTLFQSAPQWLIMLLAALVGLGGAIMAVVLQRFGVGVVGFFAGALAANSLLQSLAAEPPAWTWIVYLVAGALGALLLSVLFDWALIVLSSLVGASLMVQALELGSPWGGVLFFSALIAGILLQGWGFRSRRTARGQ